jgi:sulfate/thiosulfate-binding protein
MTTLSALFRNVSIAAVSLTALLSTAQAKDLTLLNVSYDPTRELYQEIDGIFAKQWQEKTGDKLTIKQSHGGSGSQARSVDNGLDADVVTLALAIDINSIARKSKRINADWETKFPHNSTPFTSTIVFLVRKGNPKGIGDWGDLTKPDVQVITPNPKTSGGARWNYLAAYAWAKAQPGGTEESAKQYLKDLYSNVPVLDSGARGSTLTFVQRQIGDVLLAWENEAFLAQKELGKGQFDIVVPSLSVLAEPPVAIVDKVVDKRGTREVASAYLNFLYTPEAQRIAIKNFYRPTDPSLAAEAGKLFPPLKTVSIADLGGWDAANQKHFADGAIFDQIYLKK